MNESFKRGMEQVHAFIRGEREGFIVHEAANIKVVDRDAVKRAKQEHIDAA